MLSLSSQDGAAAGLVDGRLSPSPETLNRVCSEYLSEAEFVDALVFEGVANAAWAGANGE